MIPFSRDNIMMFLVVVCVFGVLYLFRELQKVKAAPPSQAPRPANIPSAHEFMMMRQAAAPPPPPTPAPVAVVSELPDAKTDDKKAD